MPSFMGIAMPAGDHARLLKNLLGSKVTKKKKTKKYRKIPKANWFERLTVEEIKQLCKAAKLPVSGSKGDIVSRLLDSESTSHFGSESRAGGFSFTTGTFRPGKDGVSVEDLKEEMRKRSLSVTGSKHQLVLRLLQHEHGTGGAAAEGPKRAAAAANAADTTNAYDAEGNSVLTTTTTTTTTTKAQPKPRKPKAPARPNVEKLRERMEKKIYPASKSSWSDYKYKEHANDVCQLASNLVRAEAAKCFAATRDPVLLDACIAVVRPILEAGNVRGAWDDSNFTGQGRCRYNLSEALSEVEAALEGSEEVEDAFAERGRELVKLCADLRAAYEEYVGSPLDFD